MGSIGDRMDGDYEVPIRVKPKGGPIPEWVPDDPDDTEPSEVPAEPAESDAE